MQGFTFNRDVAECGLRIVLWRITVECVNLCMMNAVCSDVFYDEQGRMCTLANDVQGCVATNSLRRVTKVSKRRRHENKILICKYVSIR